MIPASGRPGPLSSPGTLRRQAALYQSVYKKLLSFHGRQGWWPIVNAARGTGAYHVRAPRSGKDRFEIAIGAILTQNISWKNVDRALSLLKSEGFLDPVKLALIRSDRLVRLIKSTGYYNQKAKKIKHFVGWFASYRYDWRRVRGREPGALRGELLGISGIGPETADSILLYALGVKIFVVDAYTVRLFTRLGALSGREKYHEIQDLFHRHFRGAADDYNEYHALIVAHGKEHCRKRPACRGCCLSALCRFGGRSGGTQ